MPTYEHRIPSPNLTSSEIFPFVPPMNPEGYRPDKTEEKNVGPGKCGQELLQKLAVAVVSLKNATPEGLEDNITFAFTTVTKNENENENENGRYEHAAQLLIQPCNGLDLFEIQDFLHPESDAHQILNNLIDTHFSKENKHQESRKATKSLHEFIQSLDFERCLDLPNYVRLPFSDADLSCSLDLITLDSKGKARLKAMGPDAPERYANIDICHKIDKFPSGSLSKYYKHVKSNLEKLLSFEGIHFSQKEVDEGTSFEKESLNRLWVRIEPVSKRAAYSNRPEVLKKMTAKIKDVCTSFLWGKSELKADFFYGNDTGMITRFPLSFLLEQAFDYPEKITGFQVASKVMKAVEQLCKTSNVNRNYLFNQAVNSLLYKEKFWRQATPEWRDLLIRSKVFPIDRLCPNKDNENDENDKSYPVDKSPLFLACRFSPYASDPQALLDAGASPNQQCQLKNEIGLCEWTQDIAQYFKTLGLDAVSCMLLKHSDVPQVEEKTDLLIKHPDFTNTHLMSALYTAMSEEAPASLVEKLAQHPSCDFNWRAPLYPETGLPKAASDLTALELAIKKALFDNHHNQDIPPSGQSDTSGSTKGPIGYWKEVIQVLARQGAGLDDHGEGSEQHIDGMLEAAQQRDGENSSSGFSASVLEARKEAIKEAIEQGWYEKAGKKRLT